ncbi:Alpha/Beta hydrolase protein, partial [Pisolithus orientalis]|uniref:Alpha/Beta hydrolase protein n=1 Tax=Pisolithus orientalis TaxID=936130 RepID=UPI002224F637
TAPYGRWESDITPELLVQGSIPFDDVFVDPLTSAVYHIERRAADHGRYVIVNTATDSDVIPSPLSARTGVQEYGGAAAIAYGGVIYFSNFADNRVYKIIEGQAAEPVSPDDPIYRYANFAVHPEKQHLLVSILEDHTVDTPQTVVNTLCVVNTTRKAIFPLVGGADFYSSPVFNPSGTKIAWQEWYHPDMPWEGSLIYVADVITQPDTILLLNKKKVAGQILKVSVSFPCFANDTTLVFTSDESGFQNPFVYDTTTGAARPVLPSPIKQDFGSPAWTLGDYPYAILHHGNTAAFVAFRDGRTILYTVNLTQVSQPTLREFPFTVAGHLRLHPIPVSCVQSVVWRSEAPGGVIRCDFNDQIVGRPDPQYTVLKASGSFTGYEGYIPLPEPITLYRDEKPLYVVYYGPKNPKYSGPTDSTEKPPCIVNVHGGPTSMEPQVLNLFKIYFTSRGYSWLDVNYGGSSGYGREYIGRLASNWGIVDVQDCYDAPRLLASESNPRIDGARVAIRGGSSGGYTTLASLCLESAPGTKYFKAATSLYGISDLLSLARDTHKFELKYMIKLLGGSVDDIPRVYKDRSPLYYAKNITVPLLVLQGAEDKVVPPEQSEKIVSEIQKSGGEDRVKYKKFPGEGHGFRLEETIKEAVKLECEWYKERLL